MTEEITIKDRLDELEIELLKKEQPECKLLHYFVPGMYARQIFMDAGITIISKIHKTTHTFKVLAGKALVKINDQKWELIEAPYKGTTEAGTRRVLQIIEPCVWITYHFTDIEPESYSEADIQKAVDKIEELIIEKNERMIEFKKIKGGIE